MIEKLLAAFSVFCIAMAVLAFIWPRRFSPCAPGLSHLHFLGASLWLCFAGMAYCWETVVRAHAAFGWDWRSGLAVLMAIALTALAAWNYLRAQKAQLRSPYKFLMLKNTARAGWPCMDKADILRQIDELAVDVDADLELLEQMEDDAPGSQTDAIAALRKIRSDIRRLREQHT